MFYHLFKNALKDFRMNGGCMVFHPTFSHNKDAWEVLNVAEYIERYSEAGYPATAEEALKDTRYALIMGGLSSDKATEELKDWQS